MSQSTRQVLVRMPKELYEEIVRLARSNDRSTAAEVRRAVRSHLQNPVQTLDYSKEH